MNTVDIDLVVTHQLSQMGQALGGIDGIHF